MGRPDSILGQIGETARCRDVQHGDGVCCAFAPQLVCLLQLSYHCAPAITWRVKPGIIRAHNADSSVFLRLFLPALAYS